MDGLQERQTLEISRQKETAVVVTTAVMKKGSGGWCC